MNVQLGTLAWPLDRAVTQHRDREAVVSDGVRITYGQLSDRVARLSGGLRALGLTAGDRVGILSHNSAPYLELVLGLPRNGLVTNALNTRLAEVELEFIVADSEIVVLAVDRAHAEVGRRLMSACPMVRTLVALDDDGSGAPDRAAVTYEWLVSHDPMDAVDVDPEALASICYTGGTTGRPKGVMLTHRNLLENAKHMVSTLGLVSSDRYLHAAPMFHAADASMMFCLTFVGGTHVVIPGFDPELVPVAIEREQITVALLVPTMINMVLHGDAVQRVDLSSLRLLIYGASPMPQDLQRRAMEVLRCGWVQLYGMTEAAPVVSGLGVEDHARGAGGEEPFATRLRSAGCPLVGVQAEVRRADGSRADVGEPGEIWVRGPNVMAGYWNRPEETAAALADGWYHSGDMAYADADGYLYVVDRLKDMIISGGENVYSTEVENVLHEHPAVFEAAVVGVPDDVWVERVHAIIVPRPGATLTDAEVQAHCRERLAGYKVPRSIEFRTEPLPKSGAGKILKRELRDQEGP
jgi:long-chain acyl-CoA synthetase